MRATSGSASQSQPEPSSPAWTPHDAASPRCCSLAQVGTGKCACVSVSASVVRRAQDRGASIRTLRREGHHVSAACETLAGHCGARSQSAGEGLDDAQDVPGLEASGLCPTHQYPQTVPKGLRRVTAAGPPSRRLAPARHAWSSSRRHADHSSWCGGLAMVPCTA
jgi:hypothetical protein